MSVRKSSHGTIFLIVSSGSPRALIASSLRSTSKKPVCPMTRSLHPPMTAHGHPVRFVATWREEFFEGPFCKDYPAIVVVRRRGKGFTCLPARVHSQQVAGVQATATPCLTRWDRDVLRFQHS